MATSGGKRQRDSIVAPLATFHGAIPQCFPSLRSVMASGEVQSLVEGFSVSLVRRVEWGEMDVFGHVNNTMFFGYFESARIEYLMRIGFDGTSGGSGAGPILASTNCRFRFPLRFPDEVTVAARTAELRPDRFIMEYRVVSHRHDKLAAEGGGVVVAYDYARGAKTVVPEAVRAAIIGLDGAAVAAGGAG